MVETKRNDRNDALEFAARTRRNLSFIEEQAANGAHVHVVTQLAVSLVGLIVFPKEKLLLSSTKKKTILAMNAEGWPVWHITKDEAKYRTATLYDIVRHLRNALAHGRLQFTSDSPQITEVAVIVEDKETGHSETDWRAEITAEDLRLFCYKFIDFIEDSIG